MQPRTLIDPQNPLLNKIAEIVRVEDILKTTTQAIIKGMVAIAKGEQGDAARRTMVGLAAPQVGILKRIIIVATNAIGLGEEPELQIFINPEILQKSKEQEEGREGCFSTGCICGAVTRSKTITIRAYDHNGCSIEETYEGFVARIFQHEIDHLDGIRFPDRITDNKKLHWVEPDQFGKYRLHWQTWPHPCKRTIWEAMKHPTNVKI